MRKFIRLVILYILGACMVYCGLANLGAGLWMVFRHKYHLSIAIILIATVVCGFGLMLFFMIRRQWMSATMTSIITAGVIIYLGVMMVNRDLEMITFYRIHLIILLVPIFMSLEWLCCHRAGLTRKRVKPAEPAVLSEDDQII